MSSGSGRPLPHACATRLCWSQKKTSLSPLRRRGETISSSFSALRHLSSYCSLSAPSPGPFIPYLPVKKAYEGGTNSRQRGRSDLYPYRGPASGKRSRSAAGTPLLPGQREASDLQVPAPMRFYSRFSPSRISMPHTFARSLTVLNWIVICPRLSADAVYSLIQAISFPPAASNASNLDRTC